MAGPPNTSELHRMLLRQQRQLTILQARFDKVTESFCTLWLSETVSAFGIVQQKRKNKKGETFADILVLSSALGSPDARFDKKMIESATELKQGKWEPLILPQDVFDQCDLLAEEKETHVDGSALV